MTEFRPSAVPLVTVDPYFSVWSFADRLTDDFTRHWTGQRHAMTGLIRIDGAVWRFGGLVEPNADRYFTEPPAMRQADLVVTPLTTSYSFEAPGVALTVRFTTPLLLSDLAVLSRPASYVSFEVRSLDGSAHDVRIYFDVTGEWCVDHPKQSVAGERGEEEDLVWMRLGHDEQSHLNRSGDDLRIEWGYFYLASTPSERVGSFLGSSAMRKSFVRNEKLPSGIPLIFPQTVGDDRPVMALEIDFGTVGTIPEEQLAVLAYDDVYSVEYFGDRLQAYWKESGQSATQMISSALEDYPRLMERCQAFDRELLTDGEKAGGAAYADLLAISYRQAIAAHKLVTDSDGELLFLSKECYSNGCMATVDVSYPSTPLFLLYNPELVEAMLRPIFKFAKSEKWPFAFAPHDIGQYPLGNGQVYSQDMEGQMPVEECGNMLIMSAAACLARGTTAFVAEHMDLLGQWADYLLEHGLDPENQLCTDDFAGHLARNANLSLKAAMGVVSYSLLLGQTGEAGEAKRYREAAEGMAAKWKVLADDGDHTKLAFGQEGTWSLKYNMIWDELFGTGLFGEDIVRREVAWYVSRRNEYGTPLDSRESYTKSDWLVWAATMAAEKQDFIALIEPIRSMLNDSPDRVPFSDWTDTLTARSLNFQHRSVVGGVFVKLLKDKGTLRAYNAID